MKALLVLAALHLPPMCSKREEAKINATNGRAVLHRLCSEQGTVQRYTCGNGSCIAQ